MKRALSVIILLACAAVLMTSEARAVFKVTNGTGFVLSALYVGDANSEQWGEDLLDGNPLLDGESVLISLLSLNSTVVNVRGRDNEGDTYTIYGVDAAREDVTIHLTDIDPD